MGGRGLRRLVIEDYLGKRARIYGGERAILVEVVPPGLDPAGRLSELSALAKTAGVVVVGTTVQRRERPDPATYIGKGKVLEVSELAKNLAADTLIFGVELTPAQARNLEEFTGLKIIDRSQLILDIFALHAGTKEAALAVELAQLRYLLPRLRGWGKALSDTGGIVGTMGPGETRLEQSRRAIRRRIQALERELKEAEQAREIRRSRRRRLGPPEIAILGYTNSGKSTLFNALTRGDAFVADQLFATLDTKVRRALLPDGRAALLTDTVGFIRDLPPQLIPAFHATLEAAREASLLLFVIDASSPAALEHLAVVRRVVFQEVLKPEDPRPPAIYVLNKMDLLVTPEDWARAESLLDQVQPGILVSAKTGENLRELRHLIAELLPRKPTETALAQYH
ncbi:MAG: GTPase HflX [Candidatus Bipolaricaulaceae bacterium]